MVQNSAVDLNQRPRPRLGVCYYPEHWDRTLWADDAKRMADLGIGFARMGEFAWALIEPKPGQFCFDWLDEAMGTLLEQGIQTMLGTPTATPPKWLVDQYDDLFAWDRDGRVRGSGSRRHYCFSSPSYLQESRRITEVIAKRYGHHEAVTMWQTDNEFGCHDTVRSYSPMARDAFRKWCADKYRDIDKLNEAWGNIFWSMTYQSFDEIELPNLTTTEANPSHWSDFFRFSSDQVMHFHKAQVELIRQYAPNAVITHNAMGHFTDYDHYDLGELVDILTWDSYPLGFLSQSRSEEAFKHRYLRQGDPDFAAFHHDLYRGCADFAVIEQQPGPVNWAPDNPAPLPGMLKLWSLEALAHGGKFTAPFRWRQAPWAQEQNHAGLLRPDDQPAQGFGEIAEVRDALPLLADEATKAKVALLFDYDSLWMSEIQPQGSGWFSLDIAESWYACARMLGADIDILRAGTGLSAYDVVLVPTLLHVSKETLAALQETRAQVVMAPRAGSKDRNGNIAQGLPPGPLKQLIPFTVARSETVPSGAGGQVGDRGHWYAWRDDVETELTPTLSDDEGYPVLFQEGRHWAFTALPDRTLLLSVLEDVFEKANLRIDQLPEGVRLRRGCGLRFAFNYEPEDQALPAGIGPDSEDDFVLGGRTLPPAGIAAWRE